MPSASWTPGCASPTEPCPGLHDRALIRLAGLRVRQGRLEEAERLLARRAPASRPRRRRRWRWRRCCWRGATPRRPAATWSSACTNSQNHRTHLATALDLLVDARLATGDVDTADSAARRLVDLGGGGRRRAVGGDGERSTGPGGGRRRRCRGGHRPSRGGARHVVATRAAVRGGANTLRAGTTAGRHPRRGRRRPCPPGARGASRRSAPRSTPTGSLRSSVAGGHARTGVRGAGVLTVREQEVLQLLGAGLSNPEIAGASTSAARRRHTT